MAFNRGSCGYLRSGVRVRGDVGRVVAVSYTKIKAIWPCERQEYLKELRNAWGFSPVVWDAMYQKYLGLSQYGWGTSNSELNKLWPLYKERSIPKRHRAVLMMTYDRAYVSKHDYGRAAEDIRAFIKDFPSTGGANHWPDIAELFESDPDIPAIGFHQTSVSKDPFRGPWNEELEDFEPFDWSTAFDVYQELDKVDMSRTPHGG